MNFSTVSKRLTVSSAGVQPLFSSAPTQVLCCGALTSRSISALRWSAVLLVADARVASNPEAAPEWAAAVA